MAINYSICFPYCLSLLISVALRRWDATSVSVRMLQRNARVLGLDVPPALLRTLWVGRGAQATPQPSKSDKPDRQRRQSKAVSLGRRAKNVPLRRVPHGRAWER